MTDTSKTGEGQTPNSAQPGGDESASEKQWLNEEKANEMISKALGARLKPLLEDLRALKEVNAKPAAAEETSNKSIENHPVFKQMKEQLDRQAQDRKRTRERLASSTLKDSLLRHNIHPDAVEPLIALHAPNVVFESDDSDNVVYRINDSDVSLDKAIKAWVEGNPAAKFFVAGKGVGGSGDTGGYRASGSSGNSETDAWRNFLSRKQ